MASIVGNVVKVTVSLLTASIKEAGFGIPLIADYHTRFSERIRFYADLDEMTGDGFATSDAAYLAAAAAFAQQPSPEEVAIGRRALSPSLEVRLTPTAINSKVYKVKVTLPSGTVSEVSYTSDSSATVAEICIGLAAVIDALAGVTAASAGSDTYISVTPTTPGQWFAVEVVEDQSSAGFAGLSASQPHADPGIATDLAAISAADDSWYGMTLTTQGAAEIAAASSWAESNEKLFIQATQDGAVLAGTVGNVMLVCQTANRFRTGLLFHQNPSQHAGAAWMGSVLPLDPGSVTFAYRQLRSLDSSPLSTTHRTNIENAGGNYFIDIGGSGVTFGEDGGGKASSGEWLDIVRDTDWYEVQIGVEHFKLKLNNNKVPMTNAGISMEEGALRAATDRACVAGFLDETTVAYDIPDISEVPSNKRARRVLDKLKVSARVQGAIHITEVTATITS